MVIKKYIVRNMNEAMTRIRYELGKNALILGKRKVRVKGIKGFFMPKVLEVTAAVENSEEFNDKNIITEVFDRKKEIIDKNELKSNLEEKPQINFNSNDQEVEKFVNQKENFKEEKPISENNILREIQEIKDVLNQKLCKDDLCEDVNDEFRKFLRKNDIDDEIIENISSLTQKERNFVKKTENTRRKFREIIEVNNNEIDGRVVFVGPTGVGKTTTIAKIAGDLALNKGKRVGLITIDTYRIGAVEQLKTYSEIINIPFKVVISQSDMENAIEEMCNCDVILIDTTGRSSKNSMQISEMRTLIEKAKPNQTHLVVSSTIKNSDVFEIIDGYNIVNYESIIITKLDETSTYGAILNVAFKSKKPISYITLGQNVPDDIIKPNKESLINMILGEEKVC